MPAQSHWLHPYLCADLSSLPLPPAALKGQGAEGLRQMRDLVVLARSVARYSGRMGVGAERPNRGSGLTAAELPEGP